MADEDTTLPVSSPLRITVRPESYYLNPQNIADEQDFSGYLNALPVEPITPQFQNIDPYLGGRLGLGLSPKTEDKVKQAFTENWLARMVGSGTTLPGDVYAGKIDPLSERGIERTQDLAGLGAVGPLAIKPGTATLGSGVVRQGERLAQDAYHGSRTPGFERFEAPKEDFMIDRMLGTHVSKDPDLAGSFVTGEGSKDFGKGVEGGVYPLKIPHDEKFLEVPQELHPYITDRNTPKTSSNINSDQNAIEMLVMKTAYKKDPELLARYLEQARAVPKEDALKLAKEMAEGKTVNLPVDGKMDMDKFIRNFRGRPYNIPDRVKAVEIFKKDMKDKGYEGLKYINTSPMETAGVKDPTSYVIFDPHKSITSKYTNTLMSETSKPGGAIAAVSNSGKPIKMVPVEGNPFGLTDLALKAKEHFGITNNPKEAGYVLPDGTLLDLSGRNQQLDYYHKVGDMFVPKTGKDYMINHRDVDHADLGYLYDEHNLLPNVNVDAGGIRQHFMDNTGAIRNNPGIGFEASYVPTQKQLHNIVSNHNRTYPGEPLSVDLVIPGTNKQIAYKQFDKPNVETVSKWIKQQSKDHPDIQLFSDSGTPGSGIAALANSQRAPTFYSAVQDSLSKLPLKNGTKEQWINGIKKYGATNEEIDYLGLNNLPKGQISRADVEKHIAENKVELGEKNYGMNANNLRLQEINKELGDLAELYSTIPFDQVPEKYKKSGSIKDRMDELKIEREQLLIDNKTKYSTYQMPGATNYREKLLTLPEKRLDKVPRDLKEFLEFNNLEDTPQNRQQYARFANSGQLQARPGDTYIGSHWDEPNVLVHVRYNDRFISDTNGPSINEAMANPKGWHITPPDQTTAGDWMVKSNDYNSKGFHFKSKEEAEANLKQQIEGERPGGPKIGDKGLKTLHIEEVQSDWHQTGRKEGYKNSPARQEELKADLAKATDEFQAAQADGRRLLGVQGRIGPQETINYLKERNTPEASAAAVRIDKAMTKSDEIAQAFEQNEKAPPDAPFKKTWDELALKRMIRQAAEEGYDAISWTPGREQSTNPSKHVSKLEYDAENERLFAYDHGKKQILHESVEPTEKALKEYIGDELAKKMVKKIDEHQKNKEYERSQWSVEKNEETGKYEIIDPNGEVVYDYGGEPKAFRSERTAHESLDHMLQDDREKGNVEHPTLSGLDMEIGGSGEYYDKILVNKVNAIAKKYGGKVEQKEIDVKKRGGSNMQNQLNDEIEAAGGTPTMKKENEKKQFVHVLKLTPELKKHALEKGFPLFSAPLPTLTPVSHDPFKPKLVPVEYNPFLNPNAT